MVCERGIHARDFCQTDGMDRYFYCRVGGGRILVNGSRLHVGGFVMLARLNFLLNGKRADGRNALSILRRKAPKTAPNAKPATPPARSPANLDTPEQRLTRNIMRAALELRQQGLSQRTVADRLMITLAKDLGTVIGERATDAADLEDRFLDCGERIDRRARFLWKRRHSNPKRHA